MCANLQLTFVIFHINIGHQNDLLISETHQESHASQGTGGADVIKWRHHPQGWIQLGRVVRTWANRNSLTFPGFPGHIFQNSLSFLLGISEFFPCFYRKFCAYMGHACLVLLIVSENLISKEKFFIKTFLVKNKFSGGFTKIPTFPGFPGFPWPKIYSLTFPGFPGFPDTWEPWVWSTNIFSSMRITCHPPLPPALI